MILLFFPALADPPLQWVTSWYGERFRGRTTASGEPFDPDATTAAHPSLPFGTRLALTNPANGARVVVRINDRGPFVHGRDLDVSRRTAEILGFVERGLATLDVEILGREQVDREDADGS